MKTHTHFLKKLTAGILGFVMTLGVGAAGFASSAGETRAADATVTFTMKGFNANSTSVGLQTDFTGTGVDSASSTGIAATARNFDTSNGAVRGNKSSATQNFSIWNTDAIPGSIKSVTLKTTSGSGTFKENPNLVVGTSSQASSTTSPRAATRSSDNKTLSWSVTGSNTYFRIYSAAAFTNGTVEGGVVTVTYEKAVTKYNVSFNMQGHGTAPSTQSIEAGGKVAEPTAPSVSGYIFGGWYEEAACTNKWNFSTGTISGTKVLYAKWTAKTALTLTAADVNMKLGDSNKSVTVTAGGSAVSGYTLASGNTNVISIVNNQLHVVGRGDATITITKAEDANNTYTSGTFDVHVDYADITSFELDYTEGTLGKGGEATLPGVTILPANANQGYSWGNPVATEGIVYTYNPSTHELAIDANNTVEGTIQFTATATGDSSKEATVVYTVQAAQIAHITGVSASSTGAIVAKQYVGDAFNPQGFSFAPTWSEGDHDVVVITANDISWNALVAGSNPTGTYLCADGEFTVTITGVSVVNDTLVSIAFEDGCDMTKKTYWVGDSWDFSGLSIVGTMDSGATAPAISSSNVTFSSNDAVATTTTSITVTAEYNNLTATKEISGIVVNEVTMDSLTVNYTGGQPVLGTDFTFAGSITANMSNNTHPTVNLSDVTIGSVDKFTLNQQTITVTHKTTGATGTFNVTYKTKNITYTTSWDKASTIAVGDTIALAHINNGQVMTGVSSNIGTNGSATISNNKLTPASGVTIYELQVVTGNSTGSIALKHGSDYLSYSGSDNKIYTSTTLNNNSSWTVTWSSGRPTITNVASNTRKIVYNTSSPRFCCYTSAQGGLDVFRKTQTASGTADIIKLNAALKSGKTFNEGATISASDFNCSTLDNLNQTKTVTATSVSPTKLVAGENIITVNYNSWSTTVVVNAAEVAHLDHIEVVEGTGTRSFTRGTSFNSTGVKIKAYYSNTDKTKFPDRELTSGFTVTPLTSAQMNVANTYDVSVSYTENGVTKNTTYSVTVTPKVSTSVTIAGDGIEGSNGAYTLASGVTNEVALTLGCDGDETVEFVQGEQNVVTFANGKLSVNSSTKTSEQITVSFKAGTATATLTVNISAAEGITLISDDHVSGFIGDDLEVEISLSNVESATWTLPSGFTVKETSKDNTGFVGSISSSVECKDAPAVFSVLTGKGEPLSVTVYVTANYDSILSIDASTSRTYVAGQSEFSKSDLTVTYERASGASGTLDSDEFTLSDEPTGILLAKSYTISVASFENPNAKTSCTITPGVPSGSNVVAKTVTDVPGATVWQKVTDLSTLSTSKQYTLIYENGNSSYMFNNTDDGNAYISKSLNNNECSYASTDPYLTINYNASTDEASIKCVGGSDALAGKYIYGKSGSNSITSGNSETMMSFEMDGNDNHIVATSNSTSFRFNSTSGDNNMRFRFYKTTTTGNAYHYPCLYEKVTKQGTQQISYSNTQQMSASLFNFIFSSYDEENGFKVSWSDMTTEFDKLDLTDKALLQKGVSSGKIGGQDVDSCDLFTDFVEAYEHNVIAYGYTDFMARGFKVHWKDANGASIAQDSSCFAGKTPVYTGAVPFKADDANYSYVFSGWDKNLGPINGETTYVAQFQSYEKGIAHRPDANHYDDEEEIYNFDAVTKNTALTSQVEVSGVDENGNVAANTEVVMKLNNPDMKFVDAQMLLMNNNVSKVEYSTDGGKTWFEVQKPSKSLHSKAVDPATGIPEDANAVRYTIRDDDKVKALLLAVAPKDMELSHTGYISYDWETQGKQTTITNAKTGIEFEFDYRDGRLSQYQGDEYTVKFIYNSGSEMSFEELWASSYKSAVISQDMIIDDAASLVIRFATTEDMSVKWSKIYNVAIVVIDGDGNLVDYSDVITTTFNENKESLEDLDLPYIEAALRLLGIIVD